jgi:FkbM family methyltransferase
MSGARSLWLASGSAVAVVVGAFGPWAKTIGLTVESRDDELVALAALLGAIALVVFAVTRDRRLAAVPLVAGLAAVAVIGRFLADPAGPFGGPGDNVHLQWGVWVALAGSIGLALGSFLLVARASSRGVKLLRSPRRVLAAFSDEAVIEDLAKRLDRSGSEGAEVLATLADNVHVKTAGRLVEELTPVRTLDYSRHPIELVVTSPAAARRLHSVEKEPFTVEWIERSVKSGDVFYDIGANVGAYALIAAKATRNRAQILAFEPSASSFHDLTRNVLLNDCARSIVPLSLALWSEDTLLPFTFRSLSAGAARHHVDVAAGLSNPLTGTILGVRLDNLVEQFDAPVPTHAKIDVDGYELEVLRGAERTLARREWRSILVELDPDESERNTTIKQLLMGAGFDSGRSNEYRSTHRYPRPGERPVVYWTFRRDNRPIRRRRRQVSAPVPRQPPWAYLSRSLAAAAAKVRSKR